MPRISPEPANIPPPFRNRMGEIVPESSAIPKFENGLWCLPDVDIWIGCPTWGYIALWKIAWWFSMWTWWVHFEICQRFRPHWITLSEKNLNCDLGCIPYDWPPYMKESPESLKYWRSSDSAQPVKDLGRRIRPGNLTKNGVLRNCFSWVGKTNQWGLLICELNSGSYGNSKF
jgi:hypothetical protein